MALQELGPSYTYQTVLSLIVEEGDTCLVLQGSGDPTLGSMRFDQQANGQEVLYKLLDELLLTTNAALSNAYTLIQVSGPLTLFL